LHSHGESDPGEDLKTASDLVEWAGQAGLLRDAEIHNLGRVHADQVRFRRALALRELLYEIFSRAANRKKPPPQVLRNFQSFYQNAIRRAEFHPVANHYRLVWPASTHPLERILQEIVRSAADLLTSEALTRVRQCSGESCSWLFVDDSRNGMRRWCDMKACGNRAKVRRFRRNLSRGVKPKQSLGSTP
jgi:predicted RNA-binding Zn ribbon-like protein